MNDTATDLEPPFERDMCFEGSHDFEDDTDRSLSPNLLRMVEQKDKQILPLSESLEIVSLMKTRIDLPTETKNSKMSLYDHTRVCFDSYNKTCTTARCQKFTVRTMQFFAGAMPLSLSQHSFTHLKLSFHPFKMLLDFILIKDRDPNFSVVVASQKGSMKEIWYQRRFLTYKMKVEDLMWKTLE